MHQRCPSWTPDWWDCSGVNGADHRSWWRRNVALPCICPYCAIRYCRQWWKGHQIYNHRYRHWNLWKSSVWCSCLPLRMIYRNPVFPIRWLRGKDWPRWSIRRWVCRHTGIWLADWPNIHSPSALSPAWRIRFPYWIRPPSGYVCKAC